MSTSKTFSSLFLAGLLCPAAAAQAPVSVLHIGDPIASMGNITDARRPRVNNHGDWLVHVETDNSDTDRNSLIVHSGSVHLKAGDQAPGLLPGYTVTGFLDHDLNDGGDLAEMLRIEDPSGNDVRALYLNSIPLLVSGDTVGSFGFSHGSTYANFYVVHINDSGFILAGCTVIEGSSYIDAMMLIEIDSFGGIKGESLLTREGDVPPGQTADVTGFYSQHLLYAFNDSANRLWGATLDASPSNGKDVMYQNQATVLAQSGQSSIVSGRDWKDSLSMLRCDMNASDSTVFRATLDDSDTTDDDLIVLDGAVYLREGDAFPLFSGTVVEELGYEAFLTDAGEVFHYCDWDGPASIDAGLFLGNKVIAREGLTQTFDGEFVTAIRSWDLAISDDGDFIMYRGTLDGADDAILLTERNIGTTFCSPEPNSTGTPSATLAKGSTDVSLNSFKLHTYNLPPSQFGYYILSMSQGDVLYPGGSQGRLCLGGKIARLVSQVKASTPSGGLVVVVDLTAIPMAPPVAVNPGETWHAQAWHRDLNPGPTSNFSRPVSVLFR